MTNSCKQTKNVRHQGPQTVDTRLPSRAITHDVLVSGVLTISIGCDCGRDGCDIVHAWATHTDHGISGHTPTCKHRNQAKSVSHQRCCSRVCSLALHGGCKHHNVSAGAVSAHTHTHTHTHLLGRRLRRRFGGTTCVIITMQQRQPGPPR